MGAVSSIHLFRPCKRWRLTRQPLLLPGSFSSGAGSRESRRCVFLWCDFVFPALFLLSLLSLYLPRVNEERVDKTLTRRTQSRKQANREADSGRERDRRPRQGLGAWLGAGRGCGCGSCACGGDRRAAGGEWVSEKPACSRLFRVGVPGRRGGGGGRSPLGSRSLFSFLFRGRNRASGFADWRLVAVPVSGPRASRPRRHRDKAIGIESLIRFPSRSLRAGSFPSTRSETQRDPSDPLCRGLRGIEPWAPRHRALGTERPGSGKARGRAARGARLPLTKLGSEKR